MKKVRIILVLVLLSWNKRTKSSRLEFSAKICYKILKSLKLALLKQQEFFNEFYFKFFNASEFIGRYNNFLQKYDFLKPRLLRNFESWKISDFITELRPELSGALFSAAALPPQKKKRERNEEIGAQKIEILWFITINTRFAGAILMPTDI